MKKELKDNNKKETKKCCNNLKKEIKGKKNIFLSFNIQNYYLHPLSSSIAYLKETYGVSISSSSKNGNLNRFKVSQSVQHPRRRLLDCKFNTIT